MSSFKDLGEIVRIAVKIEKKLSDFYDVAGFAVQSADSKGAIAVIKARLADQLSILESVSPAKYGTLEWLKFPPPLEEQTVIPKNKITRTSSPGEIFSQLMLSEEMLRDFYSKVASQVVSASQKDLFESLVVFKNNQLDGVKRLMAMKVS